MKVKRVTEVILGTVVFATGLLGILIGLVVSLTIVGIVPGLFMIMGGGGVCSVGFLLITRGGHVHKLGPAHEALLK
jgi:hypothetical protein